jgi:ABC-type sugar transport system ATPase subunit
VSATIGASGAGQAGAAGAEPAIEIVGLGKRYGAVEALAAIDLDIAPGEFLILLGPSGCGKSTLLKIIAGLEDATQGEVYIGGRLANYQRPKDRDVAMVFQNYALYPHMTVATNIGFPLAMRKVPRDEVARRVGEMADLLGLRAQLGRYPDELSGGQRQRVALGRAIIREPVAFLMDEPLSNLDALLRVQMRTELLKLHRRVGRTTVYVTHDQVEAMTMADRIVVMRDGHIQQVGRPTEVYRHPANTFVATFVGSPPMNLLAGRLAPAGGAGATFEGPIDLALDERSAPAGLAPGAAVTLGIRPEHIEVGPATGGAIDGSVELVEAVGSDTYLSVVVAPEHTLIVRVPADHAVTEGERVGLHVPPEHVRLFDGDGRLVQVAASARA